MSALRNHPLSSTWWGIKARCGNPKRPDWPHYGGRGIRVWGPWQKDFWAFVFYMGGDKPSPLHSIDRIDVNGDYEPGNVRWATSKEQAGNKVKKLLNSTKRKPPARPKKPKLPSTDPDELGFELVLTKLSRAEIARGLGIKKQNLTRWKRVPPHHVTKLAQLTGLAREDILPSMYA